MTILDVSAEDTALAALNLLKLDLQPYDSVLWQVDALFVHLSSELIAYSRWK